MGDYFRPDSLDQALAALAQGSWRPLAGGTDAYPWDATATGWGRPGIDHPDADPILDLSGLSDLATIQGIGATIELGARITWTQAVASDLPGWFDGVRRAAVEVGGRQIQNRGTLAGNLCNASPAADGAPALMALDASVRLCSAGGMRELPLGDFLRGNRDTARRPDELLTHILIPNPAADARAAFLKLGARAYLVISIASVAATALVRDGRLRDLRIAVGACSAVPQRLRALEARLDGADAETVADLDLTADLETLSPIDDVRASAAYRAEAAGVLVRRALAELLDPAATAVAAA